MRIARAVFVTIVCIAPIYFCGAQTAAPSGPSAGAPSFVPAAPSGLLQRSLDEVQQTVGAVRLDKWKRGTVRDEAGTNIDAIQRYMQGTLPAMLKEADAAPAALTKVLPLSRNVDALYDVLLHVVEAARVSAPGDQVGQLQQAMGDLEKARIALDSQIQQTADSQEKQIIQLRTTVQNQEVSLRAAATPPPAPKCPAPTPAKKKRHVTPKTQPAASSSTKTPPSKPQ
jgi:hypothetical protein